MVEKGQQQMRSQCCEQVERRQAVQLRKLTGSEALQIDVNSSQIVTHARKKDVKTTSYTHNRSSFCAVRVAHWLNVGHYGLAARANRYRRNETARGELSKEVQGSQLPSHHK